MWRPPLGSRRDVSAYEYTTRYNLQATEDREDSTDGGSGMNNRIKSQVLKRPDYRPTALRWYFIVTVAMVLSLLIAMIAYARLKMPDSDSEAIIDQRSERVGRGLDLENDEDIDWYRTYDGTTTAQAGLNRDIGSHPLPTPILKARADEASITPFPDPSTSNPSTSVPEVRTITDPKELESMLAQAEKEGNGVDTRLPCGTSTVCVVHVTSHFIKTITAPPKTEVFTVTVGTTTIYTVIEAMETTVIEPIYESSNLVTYTVETSEYTTTKIYTVTREPSEDPGEPPGKEEEPELTTEISTGHALTTIPVTLPGAPPPDSMPPAETSVITRTSTVSSESPIFTTSQTVIGGQTYFELGTTVIEVTYTPGERERPQQVIPVTNKVTVVEPGKAVTSVVEHAPIEVVMDQPAQVQTLLVGQAPQTVVSTVGGSVTNIVVVVTPTPLSGSNQGSASDPDQPGSPEGGSDSGEDGSPDGGDADGFEVIRMTVVSEVGGEIQTFTVQDKPQTVVTTNAEGQSTTFVTTPPPTVVTSRVGGTLTTFELVTTPTASDPISFTVVSTIEGSVVTFVTTPTPSSVVTTISGKKTTITSTPSPSTIVSTMKGTTKTITSVSTQTAGAEPETQLKEYNVDAAKYFVGKFLPALLGIMVAIPLRIIDLNAKIYQPFFALKNNPRGALGAESLTLHYNGVKAVTMPLATLAQGHPIPFVTSLILLGSALIVPLATEALGLKIHGRCHVASIEGCALDLGVSPGPTHALLALLALLVTLLLVLLFLTRNWESGLYANPWNVAGMAALARCRDVRVHDPRKASIRDAMAERRYGFGFHTNAEGRDEYGIILVDDAGRSLRPEDGDDANYGVQQQHQSDDEDGDVTARGADGMVMSGANAAAGATKRSSVPFMALGYAWRIAFILFLVGLFIVILLYHIAVGRGETSDFKNFMNSQTFGVRFFFAGVGVVITFAWMAFFVSVAIISPYQLMAKTPQPPERSVLLSRPTHGIYGLYTGAKESNALLLITSLMALLAEFLPLLLANIPFNLTQTYATHVVCTRITLGILGLMAATLAASLFVRWPPMPIDPRTVAGAMYYVSGSRVLLGRMEGVAGMGKRERERVVREGGGRYFYGDVDGKGRLGVEVDEGSHGGGGGGGGGGGERRGGFGEDVDTEYRGGQAAQV